MKLNYLPQLQRDMSSGLETGAVKVELTAMQIIIGALEGSSDILKAIPDWSELKGKLLEKEKKQILKARLDGFKISGEGYNGEYPYEGRMDEDISNTIS